MISCGAEVNDLRDIAQGAIRRIDQMYATEDLGFEEALFIRDWDYRTDNPRIVPAGDMAARSLAMVDRSNCVIAILGATVPTITREEILEVFEMRSEGVVVDLFLFLNESVKGPDHFALLDGIAEEYGEQVVYAHYGSPLEFQATVFTSMMAYTIRLLGIGRRAEVGR